MGSLTTQAGRGHSRWRLHVAATAGTAIVTVAAFGSSVSASKLVRKSSQTLSGTIAYSWWGGTTRDTLTEKIISLFEKKYPKVSVEPEPTANYAAYWEHLTVEAAAGNVPCVVTTQNTYLQSYTKPTILLPLNKLTKSGAISIKGIPTSIIAGGTSGGNLYMIGTGLASNALRYNTTYAKKYRIPPLTNNMTWSQLSSWIISAQAKLPPTIKAMDTSAEWNPTLLYAWVRTHGKAVYVKSGTHYVLGFPQSMLVSYWGWWQNLIKAGATTSPAVGVEEPSTSGDSYLDQGTVLANLGTANLLAAQTTLDSNHLGTAADVLYPIGSSRNQGLYFDLSGLSIGADCSNVPAAAAFVNYWTNFSAATNVYESNNGAVTVPGLLSLQEHNSNLAPSIRTSLKFFSMMESKNIPVNFDPPGYSAIVTNLETYTQAVQFKKQSLTSAARAFFGASNAALK